MGERASNHLLALRSHSLEDQMGEIKTACSLSLCCVIKSGIISSNLHLNFSCAGLQKTVKVQFVDFISFVEEKIEIERYIAVMSNKRNTFLEKWSILKNVSR